MKITRSNIKVKAKSLYTEHHADKEPKQNIEIADNVIIETTQPTRQPNNCTEKRLFTKIVSNVLSLIVGAASFVLIFVIMSYITDFMCQFKIIQYTRSFTGGYNLWSLVMTVIPSTLGALKVSSVLGYPLKNGLVPSVIILAIVLFLFSGYQFVYSVINFGLFSDFSWVYGFNCFGIVTLSGDLCLKTSDKPTQQ